MNIEINLKEHHNYLSQYLYRLCIIRVIATEIGVKKAKFLCTQSMRIFTYTYPQQNFASIGAVQELNLKVYPFKW